MQYPFQRLVPLRRQSPPPRQPPPGRTSKAPEGGGAREEEEEEEPEEAEEEAEAEPAEEEEEELEAEEEETARQEEAEEEEGQDREETPGRAPTEEEAEAAEPVWAGEDPAAVVGEDEAAAPGRVPPQGHPGGAGACGRAGRGLPAHRLQRPPQSARAACTQSGHRLHQVLLSARGPRCSRANAQHGSQKSVGKSFPRCRRILRQPCGACRQDRGEGAGGDPTAAPGSGAASVLLGGAAGAAGPPGAGGGEESGPGGGGEESGSGEEGGVGRRLAVPRRVRCFFLGAMVRAGRTVGPRSVRTRGRVSVLSGGVPCLVPGPRCTCFGEHLLLARLSFGSSCVLPFSGALDLYGAVDLGRTMSGPARNLLGPRHRQPAPGRRKDADISRQRSNRLWTGTEGAPGPHGRVERRKRPRCDAALSARPRGAWGATPRRRAEEEAQQSLFRRAEGAAPDATAQPGCLPCLHVTPGPLPEAGIWKPGGQNRLDAETGTVRGLALSSGGASRSPGSSSSCRSSGCSRACSGPARCRP